MIPWGDDTPLTRRPLATYALAVASLGTLLVLSLRSGFGQVVALFGFAPAAGGLNAFLTALFLSNTPLHLLFGLLFLVTVGRTLEDTIGRASYLLYYLVGGGITLGLYYLIHPESTHPIAAVSGAIGAILGGYLVLFPKANVRFLYWAWYWEGSFFLPAWMYIGIWALIELAWGYESFPATADYPVGAVAAMGGFASGAFIAVPLRAMAARLTHHFDQLGLEDVQAPAVVQQESQAAWRKEITGSGEISLDASPAWAAKIQRELDATHQSSALRLFERHGDTRSMGKLEPAVRYALVEACLGKGRYWRAVTLLESLLAGGSPPKLTANAHALLAALYGEHPYFHEHATPHLDLATATIARESRVHGLLHEVAKRVDAARHRHLGVAEHDRFCLVRETVEAYRISEAGPLVAKATGRDLRSVMRDLRNNSGILAWKLSRHAALDLAASLANAGIRVGVVPLSALKGYQKTEPIEHVSARATGVELHQAGEALAVPWDNMALVAGGFLMLTTEQQQRVYEEARDAALASGDPMGSFDSVVRELRHLTIIDFWLIEPRRHLRVREHPLRMPEAQLQSVATTILRSAPDIPKNEGLNAIASGVVPADCIFDGRDYFTYYGTWQLYLRSWDHLPPVSDSLLQNLVAALRE